MSTEIAKIQPKHRTKKTHEEFIKQADEKNPNIKVLDRFVDWKTKLRCECKVCGNISLKPPSNILNGCGCRECYKKRKTLTNEDFLKKLKEKNREDIIPLSEYKDSKTHMTFKCSMCNYIWTTNPASILSGTGCPKCGNERTRVAKTLPRDIYIKRLYEHFNGEIELVSDYISSSSVMTYRCKICNHIWEQDGFTVLLLKWCPGCSGLHRTPEDYVREIENMGKVCFIEKYKTSHDKVLVECVTCGKQFRATPNSLKNGTGCMECFFKNLSKLKTKTHEEYIRQLYEINPNINVIGAYAGSHEYLECECKICGNIWSTSTADSLLQGTGCPACHDSTLERKVKLYLDNLGIEYTISKTYDNLLGIGNKWLSYDFYIPHCNLLIECQGIQHEKPVDFFGGQIQFEKQKEHDRRKRKYAKSHNINLLEIWYYEDVEEKLSNYFNNLNLESVETVTST